MESTAIQNKFTHVNEKNQPAMVDVGDKKVSHREACAIGFVELPPDVWGAYSGDEILSPKGPVFQTAIIAGTQGVKNTSNLIPFCHPLNLNSIKISLSKQGSRVNIQCRVKVEAKTGVEMEALTGVSVTALTVYDMCKALSHDIKIGGIELLEKSGGKKDFSKIG